MALGLMIVLVSAVRSAGLRTDCTMRNGRLKSDSPIISSPPDSESFLSIFGTDDEAVSVDVDMEVETDPGGHERFSYESEGVRSEIGCCCVLEL
jgi:hypothetical protein